MKYSPPQRWLLVPLLLLLALCCCTQPIEEPEDAEGTADTGNDIGDDASTDTSDADSDPEGDVPADTDIPESERFCDEEYAREQLDKEIVPEKNSPCSCNGRRYGYAIGFCYEHLLACLPSGWATYGSCLSDAGIEDP